MMLMRSSFVACVVAGAGTAWGQVPTEWTFELQARSSLNPSIPAFNLPNGSSLSSQPTVIAQDGSVAIRVFTNSFGVTEGVFVGKGGEGELIISGNSPESIWSGDIALQNGVLGVTGGGFVDPAFTYDAATGTLLNTFNSANSEGVTDPSGLTLNASGELCYRGDFGFAGDKIVVDSFDDMGVRSTRLVADSFTGTYDFLLAPSINDAGQVAFNSIPSSGPSRRIVLIDPDGTTTTIAETGSGVASFVNSTDITNAGAVAYSARETSGSWSIRLGDGTTDLEIARGGESGIDNGSIANFPPVGNADGLVAFRATETPTASTAIWVGDGDDLIRLVGAGDVLETDLGPITLGFDFGGTTGVQTINSNIDINDAGQVGFAAFLENGTIGVFVATPADDECLADVNQDGELNGLDFGAWLGAFNAGDPRADQNQDGSINGIDFGAWLSNFNAGCD